MNMKQFISQDADVLHAVNTAADELGIDLQDVAIKLGLPPDLLKHADQFVPSQLFNCLLETIGRDYHCQDFAVKAATHIQTPLLGLPTRVMGLCASFQQAFERAAQYSAFYRDTSYWQHQIGEGQVCFYKAGSSFNSEHYRQRNLLGTSQMFTIISELSGHLWRPNKVSFSFADPGARFRTTFDEFFQCELEFDQSFDGVYFPEGYLEYKISSCNVDLLRGVEMHISSLQEELKQGGDLLAQAKLIINQRLSFGCCSLSDLAHFMSLPEPQLVEELERAGISFSELMDQQIAEKANYYLTEFHAPTELILSALMPGNEPHLNDLLMSKLEKGHQW